MEIQARDLGLRRQNSGQLQLCVPQINLDGDSYRLRDHHARADTLRATTTGTRQPLR
jgi:hypothetical protein